MLPSKKLALWPGWATPLAIKIAPEWPYGQQVRLRGLPTLALIDALSHFQRSMSSLLAVMSAWPASVRTSSLYSLLSSRWR
jgi:hypothetical protein